MEMPSKKTIQTYKRRKYSQVVQPASLEETGPVQDKPKNSACEDTGIVSDESSEKQNNVHLNTELCRRVFSGITSSDKFDIMRKLLADNFQDIRIENCSDFNIINSRIRDGGYDCSPQLFSEDVQKLWSTLQMIGVEMVSLAKGLSEFSRKIYHEQVRKSDARVEGKDCLPKDKSDSCRCCGGKTKGRISIVCDSCESMHHVFCAGVSVAEDSPISWYCSNCAGLESRRHDNCIVCERVKEPRSACNNNKMGAISNNRNENTNYSCKLCRCGIEDKKYRECEHSLCRNYFHIRCLSDIELKRFGPRWYCPSCLCRVCLVDQDDEKIVLCDGCDNAYHIYCMEPLRSRVPEGKWFCGICDARIKKIHKVKTLFQSPNVKA
ncbi:hypothetical protein ACHQM5_007717 [Ranunculus cassubicifolius]